MSNAARVKRLCGSRAVPGKPGTLGMKTDDIKATIKAHVDKLNKENPIRKEFTRGKKDRASLCMFLTKYREGQALLNASSNSPPSAKKKTPSPKKKKSWFEMTNGSGNSSSNNESAKSNNSGSENNIYNNEGTPPLRKMPTRTYQSRAREKDPLGNKTKFAGKMKGRVNRLLRKKGQTSKTSYGDVLKNVLTFNPRAEGPKRRALSAPGRRSASSSGNSSANRKAAKSALKGRKSTSANAARRVRFDRRRKSLSALKMSGGNGRVPMNARRPPIRTTRKPRSKYNVADGWTEATQRMSNGRRAPGTQGPELPLNGANYERMRSKFAGNAIAKKPAKKTPSPPKKSFNLTGLTNGVVSMSQQVARIRKKKVKDRTTKEKKILRLYIKSRKNESNRKKRTGPAMKMKTGGTNFTLLGSSSNGQSGSGSVGGASSGGSSSPNSGKTKAKYMAAAAKVRAAMVVPAGGYIRPKPKAKPVPSVRVSPPKAKGPTPRNDRIRKLIENMQKQKAVPESVRRMAAKPTTATIRNQRGSKGYYSLNE